MQLIVFAVLGMFAFAQGCVELRVIPGDVASFNSHESYGQEHYPNGISQCWILRAEPGYVIKVWTNNFGLERDGDYLSVRCGVDGNDGVIGRFTGENGIETPLHSNGQALYVRFETDERNRAHGFMFSFEALEVQDAPEGNCMDGYEFDMDDDDDESSESHEHRRGDSDERDSNERDSDESYSDESDSDASDESWESDESHEVDDVEDIVIGIVVMIIVVAAIAGCVVCFAFSLRARQRWYAPKVSGKMTSPGVYTSFNNPLAEKPQLKQVV